MTRRPVHKDDVSGFRRGLRNGGGALDKSACRTRSHDAHECASIHWIPWPKIVLATHGSSPLRKVGVGYWESLRWQPGKSAAAMPATMLSVRNIVIDRSVRAFARALSRIYILKEEAYCYSA